MLELRGEVFNSTEIIIFLKFSVSLIKGRELLDHFYLNKNGIKGKTELAIRKNNVSVT